MNSQEFPEQVKHEPVLSGPEERFVFTRVLDARFVEVVREQELSS